MSWLSCSVCGSSQKEAIVSLACGIFDGSSLYPEVRLVACSACGHVYNDLSPDEISGLGTYYNTEYAPANLASVVTEGDIPGSTGKYTHGRYWHLFEMLSPHLEPSMSVLDVGCAAGGFLDFLKHHGFSQLYGVDMIEAYAAKAREKNHVVKMGDAEQLPYDDGVFDALVIEQVLEHLVRPARAFTEAGRVLKPGGILCLGVPDAERYAELYYYDFYWLLMREHIQHYDIHGLKRLAAFHGFELLEFRQSSHPIMGETMVMPNLCAIFRYTARSGCASETQPPSLLPQLMKRYVEIENTRMGIKQKKIRTIANSRRQVYVWGIGREFLYLYETVGLKHCNLAGLIDMNPHKQHTVTVGGRRVESNTILEPVQRSAILLIAAIAHQEPIRCSTLKAGFTGEIVSIV
jgi:SAM-dependent methyltransferase